MCARYAEAYIDRYGDRMPAEHRRVLQLLADCQTGRLGSASYRCAECGQVHHTSASCGNRHCPNCQTANNGQWCQEQTQKLLPCEYYLVTFTIPPSLRAFVRSNQRLCYAALMTSAAWALRTVLGNSKFGGVQQTGFTSVLHTWGRDLSYHPHVHVIVPGGGLTATGQWKSTLPGFLAPVKVLSKLFRTKFQELVGEPAREWGVSDSEFFREFVSDVQAVGDGVATLKYLSRYVFRTAITNQRVLSLADGFVTFSYRRTGEFKDRSMRLPALEFLHRFLQHVLPRGLHRVRHYGFLSRRSQVDLDELRVAVLEWESLFEPDWELQEWQPPLLPAAPDAGPSCPTCGGRLEFESFHRIRPPPE